jgi:hypothetical protein
MYWSDVINNTISSANIDGTERQTIVTGLQHPTTIVVDSAAGHIYWDDLDKVRRATLDGSNVTTVVGIAPLATNSYTHATGLALDFVNRQIYASAFTGRIQRSNFDGTNRQLFPPRPAGLEGIALDVIHSHLYLVDWQRGTIGRTALDGTGYQQLVAGTSGAEHVELDLVNGKMYWGDGGGIRRANLDGTNVETVVSTAPGIDSLRLVFATQSVPGDYNASGAVDAADYVVWRNHSGQAGAGLAADGNSDGVVNQEDYNLWRAHFGQAAGSGSSIASTESPTGVPEPSALILAATASVIFLCPPGQKPRSVRQAFSSNP